MKRNQAILTGLFAGIAAGVMVLGASSAGMLAFLLYFAAPAAVYIASMGWGGIAGLVAAVAGAGLAAMFGDNSIAGLTLALLFAPAAAVGHMANLGQRANMGEEAGKAIVWFPLSLILFRLMIMLAAGFILIGYLSGYTQQLAAQAFAEIMKQVSSANPDLPQLSNEILQDRASLYASIIPLVIPGIWLLMHVLTAFLAANITRRMGVLARDEEDIAATVNLPFEAIGFIVAGLAVMMLFPDPLALAGSVLVGIGVGGYALIGLAQMHYRTRPLPSRGLILALAYASIVMFTVPLLIFTIMGIFRSMRSTSGSGPNSGSGPADTHS